MVDREQGNIEGHSLLLNQMSSQRKMIDAQRRQAKRRRTKSYTLEELEVLNLLSYPVYIYDIENSRIPWSNEAGLELWNAESLEELASRSFHEMSEATRLRLTNTMSRVTKGEVVNDAWTVYPKGQAKTKRMKFSGIKLAGDPSIKLFIECATHPKDEINQETLRGVEMLRHLPMAVCQFDMQGDLMYQNPEAMKTFGPFDQDALQEKPKDSIHKVENDPQNVDTSLFAAINGPNGTSSNDHTRKISDKPSQSPEADLPESERSPIESISNEYDVKVDASSQLETKESNASQFEKSFNKNPTNGCSHKDTVNETETAAPSRSKFLSRFVDQDVGMKVWKEVANGNDCFVQAQQHTLQGTRWSDIKVRRSTDPVTAKPVVLYSARDINDVMQAQKDKEANAKKGEFFAIMAHEIRTPLHQVTGFIDLLNLTLLDDEQRSFVNLLKTSATSLFTVINDVLDYSKLEAGKMKFEQIPFEPKDVVQGSLEAVRRSAEDQGLYLKSNWGKGIPFRILGDPNRLRQILLNLLQNAVKFTKKGGVEVCVTKEPIQEQQSTTPQCDNENGSKTSKTDYMLKFSVSDTGIGISQEQQQRIFVQYQQADSSVARNYGGTGLGLSICKGLSENMGGSIGVISELGMGSTFWFTIPIKTPPEQTVARSDGQQRDRFVVAPEASRLSVLVAEDNKVNQKLVVSMLKRMGHTATVVENGKQAIDSLSEGHAYDVVLMDIQMPVMDGIEATKRLRAQGWTELPVIGLTASQHRTDYTELGFNDWVGKPVPIKELKKKLDMVWESKNKENKEKLNTV